MNCRERKKSQSQQEFVKGSDKILYVSLKRLAYYIKLGCNREDCERYFPNSFLDMYYPETADAKENTKNLVKQLKLPFYE